LNSSNKSDSSNAVVQWFGSQFENLHPLLQELHLNGGQLLGTVEIKIARGVRGLLGRRIARKLGIPERGGMQDFAVNIYHKNNALHWDRCFGANKKMMSVFRPVGCWPSGYWIENTGLMTLNLTVDVIEGGWYWRFLNLEIGGARFPQWLLPRTTAYKRIENGKYCFCVEIELPGFGTILSYEGILEAESNAPLTRNQGP